MKPTLWTIFWICIGLLFLVFGIIPAILQWQKNSLDHDEKMMDKTIELEIIKHDGAGTKTKRRFLGGMIEFVGRIIREFVPTIAGKLIGGM